MDIIALLYANFVKLANFGKRMVSEWTFYSVTDIRAEIIIGEQIKLLD